MKFRYQFRTKYTGTAWKTFESRYSAPAAVAEEIAEELFDDEYIDAYDTLYDQEDIFISIRLPNANTHQTFAVTPLIKVTFRAEETK